MSWRLAQSLTTLRAECNAAAPDRRKYNDGDIGDAAHAARVSRHNPYRGVVTALDITHDPAHGMDVHALVRRMTAGGRSPHPNAAYIISNRQVARRSNGWRWVAYTGPAPHDGHAHFAVGTGPDSAPFTNLSQVDDTTPWRVRQEDDLNEQETRKLIESYIDPHGVPSEITAAEKHLQGLGLISKGRVPSRALTWGLFVVLLSRALKLMGK